MDNDQGKKVQEDKEKEEERRINIGTNGEEWRMNSQSLGITMILEQEHENKAHAGFRLTSFDCRSPTLWSICTKCTSGEAAAAAYTVANQRPESLPSGYRSNAHAAPSAHGGAPSDGDPNGGSSPEVIAATAPCAFSTAAAPDVTEGNANLRPVSSASDAAPYADSLAAAPADTAAPEDEQREEEKRRNTRRSSVGITIILEQEDENLMNSLDSRSPSLCSVCRKRTSGAAAAAAYTVANQRPETSPSGSRSTAHAAAAAASGGDQSPDFSPSADATASAPSPASAGDQRTDNSPPVYNSPAPADTGAPEEEAVAPEAVFAELHSGVFLLLDGVRRLVDLLRLNGIRFEGLDNLVSGLLNGLRMVLHGYGAALRGLNTSLEAANMILSGVSMLFHAAKAISSWVNTVSGGGLNEIIMAIDVVLMAITYVRNGVAAFEAYVKSQIACVSSLSQAMGGVHQGDATEDGETQGGDTFNISSPNAMTYLFLIFVFYMVRQSYLQQ